MSEFTGLGIEGGGLQLSGPLSASWSYSLARFGRHRRVILRVVDVSGFFEAALLLICLNVHTLLFEVCDGGT